MSVPKEAPSSKGTYWVFQTICCCEIPSGIFYTKKITEHNRTKGKVAKKVIVLKFLLNVLFLKHLRCSFLFLFKKLSG